MSPAEISNKHFIQPHGRWELFSGAVFIQDARTLI